MEIAAYGPQWKNDLWGSSSGQGEGERGREVTSLRGEVDCWILSRTLVMKELLN